jgi:hypothetical protein
LPDSKPPQDPSHSTRDDASNGSRPPTSELIPEPRRKKSRRELERAFEEACLSELEAAVSKPRAETTENEAGPEGQHAAAEQAVGLYERIRRQGLEMTTARMLMLVIAAAIVIQAVAFIISPFFFILNLLVACIGLLTARIRKQGGESQSEEQDADP